MATKTLESRFEHLSVKDEKDACTERTYGKKVYDIAVVPDASC
jgi:aurora kinase